MSEIRFDFVIIGSGFGGSVSAMRLAEKGYRVAILETGKRWSAATFPKSNRSLKNYLWWPALRWFGPQSIRLLRGVMILHGTGVGGGSLIYANTLMRPSDEVFRQWPCGPDWARELAPHYETVARILGRTTNSHLAAADLALKRVGEQMGIGDTFTPTEVGVYFGTPGKTVDDPYFGGEGPPRTGCTLCGGCMVGCRVGAKNTLDRNYLWFAEKWGARIFAETKAIRIERTTTGFRIPTRVSTRWGELGPTLEANRVVLAAGVLGSVELLLSSRLPNLPLGVGKSVRTNGESILGATSFETKEDYSRGLAIGASLRADEVTKIEAVRYPAGSDAMRWLAVPLTAKGGRIPRALRLVGRIVLRLPWLAKLWVAKDWSTRSVILLVMQTVDRKLQLRLGRWGLQSTGEPVPSYLPLAQSAARALAREINGEPQNVASEVLLGRTVTAHILGGCALGEVVDERHQVLGQPGLYVCDGSVIPSNLGVNPSFTIAALAERFASQFPTLTPAERADR